MSFEIGLTIAAIVILIGLSAFFNGSETALTAASRARMHALEQEGNTRAALVNRLLSRPEKMIGSVLLGNTLVDVLAAALASGLAVTLVGEIGVAYATAIVTLLIVIFAAVMPKTYALAYSDRVALAVAPIMRAVIFVLTPATQAIEYIVRQLFKLTPTAKDDEANILTAHEEIRGTIDLQAKEGTVSRRDAHMLGGVLDLRDLQVADIMVHRTKMETIDIDDSPQHIIDAVLKSQYTRMPLWKDDPENLVALLHSKNLLEALDAAGWDISKLDIAAIAQEPWFVPETTNLKDQLNQFLKRKAQLALVVDEYGVVKGLITLEDILEEIVDVDGTVTVRDINRQMDWNLPDEEATTIAGLVIHEAQTIPEPGQVFTFYGYRIEILRKSRNKITAVRIKKLDGAAAAASGKSWPKPPAVAS
jgi:Mg2+/Co2+ transporter CorB